MENVTIVTVTNQTGFLRELTNFVFLSISYSSMYNIQWSGPHQCLFIKASRAEEAMAHLYTRTEEGTDRLPPLLTCPSGRGTAKAWPSSSTQLEDSKLQSDSATALWCADVPSVGPLARHATNIALFYGWENWSTSEVIKHSQDHSARVWLRWY